MKLNLFCQIIIVGQLSCSKLGSMGSCHLFQICSPSVVYLNVQIFYLVSQYQVLLTGKSTKIPVVGILKSEQFPVLVLL